MLKSTSEKGKCVSYLRITYSKLHIAIKLKTDFEEMGPSMLGEFAKEETMLMGGTYCIFLRKEGNNNKHLRIINISREHRGQAGQRQGRDERSLHS